jgi:hypothetical protein
MNFQFFPDGVSWIQLNYQLYVAHTLWTRNVYTDTYVNRDLETYNIIWYEFLYSTNSVYFVIISNSPLNTLLLANLGGIKIQNLENT